MIKLSHPPVRGVVIFIVRKRVKYLLHRFSPILATASGWEAYGFPSFLSCPLWAAYIIDVDNSTISIK